MLFIPSLLLTACGEEDLARSHGVDPEMDRVPEEAPLREGYVWNVEREKYLPVTYAEVDGLAIHEGDMVLGTVKQMEARVREVKALGLEASGPRAQGLVKTDPNSRWPTPVVPYTIDSGVANQNRIQDAINHWHGRTHIRFVLRTASNAAQYPDYLRVQSGSGCSASYGRQGGEQGMWLDGSCSTGTIIHEFAHVLGLDHEHNRQDRDTYVIIRWENMVAGASAHFQQNNNEDDDAFGYDYGSIMHYGPMQGSRNGRPTIEARGGQSIGQRDALSTFDAITVTRLFTRTFTLRAPSGHYVVAEGGGGGTVNANRVAVGPWERLQLVDLDGGALMTGDLVQLQTINGNYVQAANGGGSGVNANPLVPGEWETFRIWKMGGPTGEPTITANDIVVVGTFSVGYPKYWEAVGGGGAGVLAHTDVGSLGPSNMFTVGYP
ncbi:M12 family metallopeptidase [Myxococcus stipitatus]|uniref:M12 family metallopeptidase n=1 Tax=Myxococcus stipitatus TaxID=83455 RepID=UPI0002FFC68D|nr:M12 family metallopeptidase [Myxococcus stipitatus]